MKRWIIYTLIMTGLLSSCGGTAPLRQVSYGNPNAPVEMNIYSDYKCAYCHDFFQNTLPKIQEEFVASGKVSITYHDFPIINEDSWDLAKSALCAFREKPAAFPEAQGKIFAAADVYSREEILQVMKDLQISTERIEACIDAPNTEEFITAQKREAGIFHITKTPTFRIGNQQVSGEQPYEFFAQAIQLELDKKK